MPRTQAVEKYVGTVDAEHLIRDHGVDRAVVNRSQPAGRAQQRHLKLWLEMQHSADHSARKVGHEHN